MDARPGGQQAAEIPGHETDPAITGAPATSPRLPSSRPRIGAGAVGKWRTALNFVDFRGFAGWNKTSFFSVSPARRVYPGRGRRRDRRPGRQAHIPRRAPTLAAHDGTA